MKVRLLTAIVLTAILGSAASLALADTYNFVDNWINWPGPAYNTETRDEIGKPWIDSMDVTVEDGKLKGVRINLGINALGEHSIRLTYDSLFINTSYSGSKTNLTDANWDDWDYLVRNGYNLNDAGSNTDPLKPTTNINTAQVKDGFYSVKNDPYAYTLVLNETYNGNNRDLRVGNPNGILNTNLEYQNAFTVAFTLGSGNTNGNIYYDFGDGLALNGGFFIAYAPWCANDVIGGGAPVPEPATMLLFGTGLIGLAGFARRRSKK